MLHERIKLRFGDEARRNKHRAQNWDSTLLVTRYALPPPLWQESGLNQRRYEYELWNRTLKDKEAHLWSTFLTCTYVSKDRHVSYVYIYRERKLCIVVEERASLWKRRAPVPTAYQILSDPFPISPSPNRHAKANGKQGSHSLHTSQQPSLFV